MNGHGTVPAAFRQIVSEHAERPAVEADGVTLTYGELDRLSNRIANGLLAQGGEQPIAAVAPPEPMSLVLMLGALKAGRIFAPLDPRNPSQRHESICEQLGASLLTDPFAELAIPSEADPALDLDPYQPSLVYFTSGSSGRPKGTIWSHKQLTLTTQSYDLGPGDRFGVIVPLAFAGSIRPVFGSLLSGGTACLFDPITEGTTALGAWIDHVQITVLQTVPSVLRAVVDVLEQREAIASGVRLAVVSGEPCDGEDIRNARRVMPAAVIAHSYGSSEAGFVGTTLIGPGDELPRGVIPIRHLFPWNRVEIVDDEGSTLAVGEEGEIVVSGNEISLGYWHDSDGDGQRFFERQGVRCVRTGDRGRLRADGALELLGRGDLRVKIHGQTVDLQAVERALAALSEVTEAVVTAVPGRDENLRLVAHVLPAGGASPTAGELRRGLSTSLPSFMIPAAFVRIDEVPRTERGKVDRELLRVSAFTALPVEVDYAPASTSTEQTLVELTADLLGLERVGVNDDLFELGIDSLSSVELLAAIDDRLGVHVAPGDLLEASTIRQLAERMEGRASSAGGSVFPLVSSGSGTPFFCVPAFDGAMLQLRGLARKLGRPVYAFVPRGLDERALPDRTVERAAARFVAAMRGVQPSGPYLIGGYSFGGIVAFEMARQLASAGQEVALLALIDSASVGRSSPDLLDRIWAGGNIEDWSQRTTRQRVTHRVTRRFANWGAANTAGIVRWIPRRQGYAFLCLSFRMLGCYHPAPYDGPVLILLTRGWDDYSRAIQELAVGPKQVADIPGNHRTLLREPHLTTVAARLREALEAADENA